MTILGTIVVAGLVMNLIGAPIRPGPGPLAIASVYVLLYASVAFLATYSLFLRD
jgi:hypothetical protein